VDKDNSGFVDAGELYAALKKIQGGADYSMSDCKELVGLFNTSADFDGLSFADFKQLVEIEAKEEGDGAWAQFLEASGMKGATGKLGEEEGGGGGRIAGRSTTTGRCVGRRSLPTRVSWNGGREGSRSGRRRTLSLGRARPRGSGSWERRRSSDTA
jgi:hypothetical protein